MKNKLNHTILILLLFVGASPAFFAQVNDAGMWLGVEVEKNITQKFSIALNPQLRLNDNYSELGTALCDLKINYKVSNNFKISANYRLANSRQLDNHYDGRQRFFVDLSYKLNIKKFSLTERIRFQDQIAFAGEKAGYHKMYLRSKLSLKYDTEKKLKPFVTGDIWYSFQNGYIDNFRFALGANYEINKLSSVDVSYMVNRGIATKNAVTSHIIAVAYNYSF